ncbi:MAG: hypothetical protein Q4C60_02870 [Eubacteriales bacterium]|nr:hypothetical protein [Eubacteriales bacterium]
MTEESPDGAFLSFEPAGTAAGSVIADQKPPARISDRSAAAKLRQGGKIEQ